jgi:hypothetical protein
MIEQASALHLMMTVAQLVKFLYLATRIRFLIAETETGCTLLAVLYYAPGSGRTVGGNLAANLKLRKPSNAAKE